MVEESSILAVLPQPTVLPSGVSLKHTKVSSSKYNYVVPRGPCGHTRGDTLTLYAYLVLFTPPIYLFYFIYCHLYSAFSIVQCSNALYRL